MKYKKFINKIYILLSIITFIVLFIVISEILQNNHEHEYNIDTETYDLVVVEEIYTVTEEMYINTEEQEPTEVEEIYINTEEQEPTEVEQQENTLDDIDIYEISNLECILQNPELPTGCEVTSLDIVLQYLGFNIDKCDLSDNYLPKCKIGTDTPYNAFLGNPRDSHSYGCYSPVIVSCCNDYFSQNGIYNYEAADISGLEFEELFEYVCNDTPVIVWGTTYMSEPYESTTWNINGSNFTWKASEHCMVLYGFNLEENIVCISDPLVGNTKYNLDVFKDRYNKMYKQAVIIQKVQ